MVIGLIEGDHAQRMALKQEMVKHRIFSSELVRMEARILPLRQDNQYNLQLYDRFFNACDSLISFDRDVFD
ncbi:MAG: hypothetical protein H6974_04770 [Gammaproteobacteria bacterium]|nr:hypothetical protein [Gammaproteobacteria bacterium]MCP5196093.1 hypothetical protein [Gammaproteobacteria bacterium]